MAKNPMSCGAECSRITLITLNVIFILCGIALFVVGMVFKFGGSSLKDDIKPVFEDIEISGYDFYTLTNSLAIMFIVAGAVIIIFAFFGFVGACCMSQCALVTYSILIGLCLALELAGIILFFVLGDSFEDKLKDGMKKAIEKANDGNVDAEKGVKYLFETFECCHVENVRYTGLGAADTGCVFSSTLHQKDCYQAFKTYLKRYQGAFIGVGIAVMVIQILCIIMACWLCRGVKESGEVV